MPGSLSNFPSCYCGWALNSDGVAIPAINIATIKAASSNGKTRPKTGRNGRSIRPAATLSFGSVYSTNQHKRPIVGLRDRPAK